MSKTAIAAGEIAGAIALMVLSFGSGSPIAIAWGVQAASALFAVGLSAGITGVFGLLQPLLNPQDISVPGSETNAQSAAAYRRVIYGYMECGGVLTFDSAPAGNGGYQNYSATRDWRHQVYTVASHQITSFQRGGTYHVVIDGIDTVLTQDVDSAYWYPLDALNPYGGVPGGPGSYHIAFEFDMGDPLDSSPVFPELASACPNWTDQCQQRGRAKVHVAMRYDNTADGSTVGSSNMSTSAPIYVNGRVPSFRFQVTGKILKDTRLSPVVGGVPAWQANTPFGYAQYVIDAAGNVQVQINGPGASFTSGNALPNFAASTPGGFTADNQCSWINAGPIQAGGWPGPNRVIAYPYVFTDPNGNLQMLQYPTAPPAAGAPLGTYTTGPAAPAVWESTAGAATTDGGAASQGVKSVSVTPSTGGGYSSSDPIPVSFTGPCSRPAVAHGVMVPHIVVDPRTHLPVITGYDLAYIDVTNPGLGYTSPPIPDPGNAATLETLAGILPWLCLGIPDEFAYATNPSNPALAIYDYLTDTEYGLGVDPDAIDLDSVNAAANICEEQVVVNIASNGGSLSENRYDCVGLFDHSAARGDVLKSMVGSMAGTCIPPGDQWHLFAGAYASPVIALTDADLRDSIKADFRISRRDLCNGVKGTFIPSFLPANTTQAIPGAWRWTDFPPYQGNGLQGHPNYIAEDGGAILWKEARFGFTTSIFMVQRLAKIILQQLRYQITINLACKLTAFPVQAGDTVTFTHARWAALDNPPPTIFFVTQATLVIENKDGVPCLGVDLVLRQHDPAIYDFTAPSSLADQGEYSTYASLGTIGG